MKANISISRDSSDSIRISIQDDSSRERIALLTLGLSDYARLITGQAFIHANVEYGDLSRAGKRKVIQRRSITAHGLGYSRPAAEEWLKNNAQEDGWILDHSLGSQGSISHTAGGALLKYSVYRYEDYSEAGDE